MNAHIVLNTFTPLQKMNEIGVCVLKLSSDMHTSNKTHRSSHTFSMRVITSQHIESDRKHELLDKGKQHVNEI